MFSARKVNSTLSYTIVWSPCLSQHVKLAKMFESLVRADDRFEVLGDVIFGVVCFRLKVGHCAVSVNLYRQNIQTYDNFDTTHLK